MSIFIGLPLLLWNNTVLVARYLHPLKATLCHLFKTWAKNRKFDFYRSNYGGFASPLVVPLCTNHANRVLRLALTLFKQRCHGFFLSKRESLPQKPKLRYLVHRFLNNLFNTSCVFENTQYLNQIVSLNTFFPPFEINVFYIPHPCLPISMMEEYQ